MSIEFSYAAQSPHAFPNWSFKTVQVDYDRETQSIWMSYRADAPPFYSLETLSDMASVRESVRGLFASGACEAFPVRYVVMASLKPGVFKLGGDLSMFARSIRDAERDLLRTYAHACIDVVYGLASAFDLPIITLSVIGGQALGGGLEAALAQDFVLAEETARMGVPEVGFNTFPGMGAVSFLSRRLGTAGAEEIITSGRIYSGSDMYDLGVVDLLAQAQQGRTHALAWMAEGAERFARRRRLAALRRTLFPVSKEELLKITDLWVDCSCAVSSQDVRHMERLAAAQIRKFA